LDEIGLEPGEARFQELRAAAPMLGGPDAALLAYAKGLTHWHSRHRFCGVCGHATRSEEAGHVRRCTDPACATSHFPRTDPAVIMLVTDGERCLLGRQAAWQKGMYSTLAGFVEPGESLEEAVAREVFEEAGVRVGRVHYHSSQPWPFPASLMIGFHAEASDPRIVLDDDELTDARWFTRAQVRAPAAHGFTIPGPDSIARRLIDDWVES
jgi:NAD+ diphosphatase